MPNAHQYQRLRVQHLFWFGADMQSVWHSQIIAGVRAAAPITTGNKQLSHASRIQSRTKRQTSRQTNSDSRHWCFRTKRRSRSTTARSWRALHAAGLLPRRHRWPHQVCSKIVVVFFFFLIISDCYDWKQLEIILKCNLKSVCWTLTCMKNSTCYRASSSGRALTP